MAAVNVMTETPPDPFDSECAGCRDGSNVHTTHGFILEGPEWVIDDEGRWVKLVLSA